MSLQAMMNRNECDRHLCTLLNWAKLTNAKSQYLFIERKNDEVVVETQVLGVKPPQICKKKQKKNAQKFGGCKKQNIKEKKGNKKNCINPGNNFHIKYHNNNNGK